MPKVGAEKPVSIDLPRSLKPVLSHPIDPVNGNQSTPLSMADTSLNLKPPVAAQFNEVTLPLEDNSRKAQSAGGDSVTVQFAPPSVAEQFKSKPGQEQSSPTVHAPSSKKSPQEKGRAAPPEAARVHGYEILSVLGRGGMGVVYKARQKGLNRLTALKMILAGGHAGSEDLIRFQIEAEAVAKLQHPNIVQIYEVGEQDGHPYFSLEFVDGGTLQTKLDGTPLTARQSAELMEQLARAMNYAHQRGIVHRDLKPANVLLTADGIPKVTDFGLAKRLGDDSHQTGTGHIMGTPSFMAPEQAEGRVQDIGPAADIYSLGALLYNLITGRPPFVGATVLDTLQQVQSADPVAPSRLQPRVPADLETICLKCLEKEPTKRYLSADELADDLRRFLNNEPIKARPIGLRERIWKWARRRPAVAALLGLLALVLTSSFIGMFFLMQAARHGEKLAFDANQQAQKEKQAAEASEKEAKDSAEQARIANEKAQSSLDKAQKTLYAASMNLAQGAFADAKVNRLRELLEDRQIGAAKLRGFEWDYLWGLFQSDRLSLKSHTQSIRTVAFRPPEGKQLASASADGSIILWDPEAPPKERYRFLRSHIAPVRALNFSRDGMWLASGGEDGQLLIWNLSDSAHDSSPRKLAAQKAWINAVAFSPNGDRIAAAGEDGIIRVFDLAKGNEIAVLKGHLYAVTDLAFSPDGQRLASASLENKVRVWDLGSAKEIFFPLEHDRWVNCVAFSSDGKQLASGGWDEKIKVWDADTGNFLFYLEGQKSPVRTMAFSPDHHRLAAAFQDQSVIVWDLVTKKILRTFPPGPGLVRSVAFSNDGQLLASVNFDTVTQQTVSRTAPQALLSTAFGANDNVAGAGCVDGKVYVWNLAEESDPMILLGHVGPVRALAYSKDRKEWASGGEDGTVIFWGEDGQSKASKHWHDRWILGLVYDPKGKTLATASADGSIGLWNLANEKDSGKFKDAHNGAVLSVAFSPDGAWLISGGADRQVKLWDLQDQKSITLGEHLGPVPAVAFSPDGNLIASAGWDGVILVWDRHTKKNLHLLRGHTHGVSSLAFSPDGKRLASGSEDKTLKIWDLSTGQETLTLKGHTQGLTGVAFSPDGVRLISSGWDRNLVIWDAGKK